MVALTKDAEGNQPEDIGSSINIFSASRPHFGKRQVRTLGGLVVGKRYHAMNQKKRTFLIKITGEPWQNEDGDWWVECVSMYSRSEKASPRVISLFDHGVVADAHNKQWHRNNWLKRID